VDGKSVVKLLLPVEIVARPKALRPTIDFAGHVLGGRHEHRVVMHGQLQIALVVGDMVDTWPSASSPSNIQPSARQRRARRVSVLCSTGLFGLPRDRCPESIAAADGGNLAAGEPVAGVLHANPCANDHVWIEEGDASTPLPFGAAIEARLHELTARRHRAAQEAFRPRARPTSARRCRKLSDCHAVGIGSPLETFYASPRRTGTDALGGVY
jgi:hypothetical protein